MVEVEEPIEQVVHDVEHDVTVQCHIVAKSPLRELFGRHEQQTVAAGEEVQVTEQDQVVARVVPPKPAATPDFLARAKAVWGETPSGKALSTVVSEARGCDS